MKTVGKPKLVFSLIINGIIILWAIFLFSSPYTLIKPVAVFLIIISLIYIFPSLLFPDSIWMVDQFSIRYNSFNNYSTIIKTFYNHYILRKPMKYQINLKLEMIKYVRVTYSVRPASFLWGCYYDVCFDIRTKDNSEFFFRVLETGKKRKDFNEAIDLLKEQNICIVDKFNILNHLKTSPERLSTFLEKIEKDKEIKK